MVVYAMTGFFLSMIYGPMTKVVAENTDPIHTTRCSLGYTFASFLGSPMAGLLAVFLSWQSVFAVSSAFLFTMAIVCFSFFCLFEKKKIIQYGNYKPAEKGGKSIKVLFKYKIVKYSIISIITGVVRTSVVFWLPTYISQRLSFSPEHSAGIYTAATLAISATAFIAVFVFERLHRDIEKTVLIMFISSGIFFALTYFVEAPVVNIICIVLAIMSSNGAACMLWSRYCPSLRDTGLVSSVTGFLDFLSYMAAAASNLIFANAIKNIGWSNLILVWLGLVVVGVVISLPYDKFRRKAEAV
jgi:predicted MFS family arabinose efflux permease